MNILLLDFVLLQKNYRLNYLFHPPLLQKLFEVKLKLMKKCSKTKSSRKHENTGNKHTFLVCV